MIVAVSSLGIAFATFSSTLTINGNAEVEATTWDVHFDPIDNKVSVIHNDSAVELELFLKTGGATVVTKPTITDTIFSGMKFQFSTPGDSIKYVWGVHNAGNYDAKLINFSTYKISSTGSYAELYIEPICTSSDNNATANKICSQLKSSFVINGIAEDNPSILKSGNNWVILFDFGWNNTTDPNDLPSVPVETTIPQINLPFEQVGTAKFN